MDVLESDEDAYSDENIAATIRKDLKEHSTHYRGWRKLAKESYDFVASEQWTSEEKLALEETYRTPIVFNRIARTINAVTGLELQNRQEVTYKPVGVQNTGAADVMNSAAKWVRSNCDAEDEESEAFADTLICGVGALETSVDYTTNLDGMIMIERRDPLEVAADHRAKKRNFDDARWVASWKSYSEAEFKELWPGVEVSGKDLLAWDDTQETVDHADDEYKYDEAGDSFGGRPGKDRTVVKYQYFCEEDIFRVDVGGELKTLTAAEYEAIKPLLSAQGINAVPQKKRAYKQVVICGSTIIEHGPCPIDGFTIRFITGLRNRNRNVWFGLVELMKDPQRWANKWLSQIQYIINTNAKGGLLYEANTFTNPKKAKSDWAKPNTWIEVVKGALVEGRVKDRTPPAYPEGIDRLLSQALTAINDVPGVNVEMLGIADRNQPGIVEDSRKNAGVTILASFFDALRRYRKENGRVLKMFILGYITDGRLIRIDGANGGYVPLNRESLADNYDILVDDAPTSANMKDQTFKAVSALLPMALQAGIPIPPEVLEYAPLPSALVSKWLNVIEEQKAGDPEKEMLKQQMVQMEEQSKLMLNELTNKVKEAEIKADSALMKYEVDTKTVAVKEYEAETDRMKLALELRRPVESPVEEKTEEGNQVMLGGTMGGDTLITHEMLLTKMQEIKAQKEAAEERIKEDASHKVALLQGLAGIQQLISDQVTAINQQTFALNRLADSVDKPKTANFQPDGSIQVVSIH